MKQQRQCLILMMLLFLYNDNEYITKSIHIFVKSLLCFAVICGLVMTRQFVQQKIFHVFLILMLLLLRWENQLFVEKTESFTVNLFCRTSSLMVVMVCVYLLFHNEFCVFFQVGIFCFLIILFDASVCFVTLNVCSISINRKFKQMVGN